METCAKGHTGLQGRLTHPAQRPVFGPMAATSPPHATWLSIGVPQNLPGFGSPMDPQVEPHPGEFGSLGIVPRSGSGQPERRREPRSADVTGLPLFDRCARVLRTARRNAAKLRKRRPSTGHARVAAAKNWNSRSTTTARPAVAPSISMTNAEGRNMDHLLKGREIASARGDRDAVIDAARHAADPAGRWRGRSSGRLRKPI